MRYLKAILVCSCLCCIGLAAADPVVTSKVSVFLGERWTNTLAVERVCLPVVGPVVVKPQRLGNGVIRFKPERASFGVEDVVAINLELDLHGVDALGGIAPLTVETDKGNFILEFFVTVIPFSDYTPNRFTISPGDAPVSFKFQGAKQEVIYESLRLEPADAPVKVDWLLSEGGRALRGVISAAETPAAIWRDGRIHEGMVIVRTKDGNSDFMKFGWLIPKPAVGEGGKPK